MSCHAVIQCTQSTALGCNFHQVDPLVIIWLHGCIATSLHIYNTETKHPVIEVYFAGEASQPGECRSSRWGSPWWRGTTGARRWSSSGRRCSSNHRSVVFHLHYTLSHSQSSCYYNVTSTVNTDKEGSLEIEKTNISQLILHHFVVITQYLPPFFTGLLLSDHH